MTRHAKNACSFAVFSHAERARLQYGTQARRAGGDAQKPFDHCELCLGVAQNPVLCHKGHLFCRSCIIESLGQQKELNKLALAKFEAQQASAGTKAEAEAAAAKQKQIAAFEKLDSQLLKGNARLDTNTPASTGGRSSTSPFASTPAAAASASAGTTSAAPAGYVAVSTNSGTGYVVDRATVHALNDPSAPRDVQASRAAFMPAFWMPTMAPADVGEEKMRTPPPQHCLCPASNHTLRLKQLRPVHFHVDTVKSAGEVKTSSRGETSTSSAQFKPLCFSCRRHLHNSTPMICVRSCGHVLCKHCVDTIMCGKKSNKTANASNVGASSAAAAAAAQPAAAAAAPSTSTRVNCLECDEACGSDDLVQIVAATGFAAGGNQTSVSKLTPAFRC